MPSGGHHHQAELANFVQIVQHAKAVLTRQANIDKHNINRIAMQLPPEGFGAAHAPGIEAAMAQKSQQLVE
ncbi:Uncharacterised protein [Klebsiella michiganensis]|uniref:Uncharacterized protein n=1 Tax=Klebsiella michiganensis TaxID=1134687 RepID=A0A7H4PQ54_9ENTR|nr:Uncharacterised protein [Klebsiella michiganensis]